MSISKYEVLKQDPDYGMSFGVYELIYELGVLIHVSDDPVAPMGEDFFELAKDADLMLKAVQKAALASEIRSHEAVVALLSVPD